MVDDDDSPVSKKLVKMVNDLYRSNGYKPMVVIFREKIIVLPYHYSHLNALSSDEEYAIMCDDNMMLRMFRYTHLHPEKPVYHNIGYDDEDSDKGYIFNGKKFEERPINDMLHDVCVKRLKDIKELHEEIEEFFTDEFNKTVRKKIKQMDKALKNKRASEKMFAPIKKLLCERCELFVISFLRSYAY